MSMRFWQMFGLLLIFASLGTFLGGCCVVKGTMIATPTEERPIESIVVGDKVLSMSPHGNVEQGYVTKVRQHKAMTCLCITLDNGSCIRVTHLHPIATRTGWTKASRLTIGQEVQVEKGWTMIAMIRTEWGLVDVYDISVSPYANFIADGVIVHNKSYVAPLPPASLPGSWIGSQGTWEAYRHACRMELYPDGTGLFATPEDIYRISGWSPGKDVSPNSYEFHALLEPLECSHVYDPCKSIKIRGEIDWNTIRFCFTGRHRLTAILRREKDVNEEMNKIINAIKSYRPTTIQSRSLNH